MDLGDIREQLRPFYSDTGRPSVDPELMIRMLFVGYCMGIRSRAAPGEQSRLSRFCRAGPGPPGGSSSAPRRASGSGPSAWQPTKAMRRCGQPRLARRGEGHQAHIPVFDKSARRDGTFERADLVYDHADDSYICPGGKRLRQRRKVYREPRPFVDENGLMRYARASSRPHHQLCT